MNACIDCSTPLAALLLCPSCFTARSLATPSSDPDPEADAIAEIVSMLPPGARLSPTNTEVLASVAIGARVVSIDDRSTESVLSIWPLAGPQVVIDGRPVGSLLPAYTPGHVAAYDLPRAVLLFTRGAAA